MIHCVFQSCRFAKFKTGITKSENKHYIQFHDVTNLNHRPQNTSRRSWSSIPFPSNLFRSCEFSREIFFPSFYMQFTIGHSGDRVWGHSAVLWGVHRNEPYTVSPRYPQPRQTYIFEAGPCSVAALGGRWWGFPGIQLDLSTDHSPTTCPR